MELLGKQSDVTCQNEDFVFCLSNCLIETEIDFSFKMVHYMYFCSVFHTYAHLLC